MSHTFRGSPNRDFTKSVNRERDAQPTVVSYGMIMLETRRFGGWEWNHLMNYVDAPGLPGPGANPPVGKRYRRMYVKLQRWETSETQITETWEYNIQFGEGWAYPTVEQLSGSNVGVIPEADLIYPAASGGNVLVSRTATKAVFKFTHSFAQLFMTVELFDLEDYPVNRDDTYTRLASLTTFPTSFVLSSGITPAKFFYSSKYIVNKLGNLELRDSDRWRDLDSGSLHSNPIPQVNATEIPGEASRSSATYRLSGRGHDAVFPTEYIQLARWGPFTPPMHFCRLQKVKVQVAATRVWTFKVAGNDNNIIEELSCANETLSDGVLEPPDAEILVPAYQFSGTPQTYGAFAYPPSLYHTFLLSGVQPSCAPDVVVAT